jgi:hypothetical protein
MLAHLRALRWPHQQRLAVNVRRAGVAAGRLQYVGCDALCLVGTLHPQRHERTFERLVAGVSGGRRRKQMASASTAPLR